MIGDEDQEEAPGGQDQEVHAELEVAGEGVDQEGHGNPEEPAGDEQGGDVGEVPAEAEFVKEGAEAEVVVFPGVDEGPVGGAVEGVVMNWSASIFLMAVASELSVPRKKASMRYW